MESGCTRSASRCGAGPTPTTRPRPPSPRAPSTPPTIGGIDCGLAQVFEPYGDDVAGLRAAAEGCEIFSLVRQSDLTPGGYLDTFFDTGREQQHVI